MDCLQDFQDSGIHLRQSSFHVYCMHSTSNGGYRRPEKIVSGVLLKTILSEKERGKERERGRERERERKRGREREIERERERERGKERERE